MKKTRIRANMREGGRISTLYKQRIKRTNLTAYYTLCDVNSKDTIRYDTTLAV